MARAAEAVNLEVRGNIGKYLLTEEIDDSQGTGDFLAQIQLGRRRRSGQGIARKVASSASSAAIR